MSYSKLLPTHIYLSVVIVAYFFAQLSLQGKILAQPTYTPTPTASIETPNPSVTVPVPLLIFSTPPPIYDEEPLSSGFRNVPAVFPGTEKYHAIQAKGNSTVVGAQAATTPLEAVEAVVQIRRCDQFGCDTPVGTGVIIHESGLILTAYHTLLEDPDDLTSPRYEDFVIAMTDNVRTPPTPRYHATVVAEKNEQDIALLAIDSDLTRQAVDPNDLHLLALPFADVNLLFADTLHILGFPLAGGDAVNYVPATFTSFDSNGQVIVVDKPLNKGNSGGPALALQGGKMAIAGLVIRGRSTFGRLEQIGVLRAIDQVIDLNWAPRFGRVLGTNISIAEHTFDGEPNLTITIEITSFDLTDEPLRLLVYIVDSESGQPWQLSDQEGAVTLWVNLMAHKVIDSEAIELAIPVAELGTTPDRLQFYEMLWDPKSGRTLWASREGSQLNSNPLVVNPRTGMNEPKQDATSVTTAPIAPIPATPQSPQTPGQDGDSTSMREANSVAIETAVSATLEALALSTPTVDEIAVRLTALAVATATPVARPPTATTTPTLIIMPSPTPLPGATRIAEHGISYAYVPAGEFLMGSTDVDLDGVLEMCLAYRSNCERSWFENELPQQSVSVDGFWLMQTEVTNEQYRLCVDAGICKAPQNDHWQEPNYGKHPVTNVDWYQANTFAQWLGGRLPTEAEWEKACRGTDSRSYPWGNQPAISELLNYAASGVGDTVPVGSYPSGPYNLYDMVGNVWEWTNSENRPYPYNAKDGREAFKENAIRTLRGGSRSDLGAHVRCAVRGRSSAGNAGDTFGFRVAIPS